MENFRNSFSPEIIKQIGTSLKKVQSAFTPQILQQIGASLTNFQNPFTPEMVAQIQAGFKRYERLIENDGFVKLASLGWYINGGMSMAHATELMDMALEGEIKELENDLIIHYKEELTNRSVIFERGKSKRALIIKEGIDCHLEGRYHASISLFLSQADGITKGLLFRTKDNKRDLKKFVAEEKDSEFFHEILNVILKVNTIDAYFSKDLDSKKGLNRHAVLHGYDTDFGTEINSLKAFLLLLFVNDFLTNHKL